MSSLNKVQLIGRLGKDPEIKHTNDNIPVAKFSLATTDTYKDKSGQKQESTEWHNIVCWRHQAEFAEKYLSKGKQIYIEGKIRTRSWDDKEGVKRYTTEINVENLIILEKRDNSEQQPYSAPASRAAEATSNHVEAATSHVEASAPEDDLPF